jgi:hypothetical protein
MAKQTISLGATANDGTGSSLRVGGDMINDNFDELYAAVLASTAANLVYAGPTTGSAAPPSMRALVAADIPSLSDVYQPLDADLTAIAALTTTAFGRAALVFADAAAARTAYGLVIGTNVQAYDGDLTTLGAGGSGARSFLGLGTSAVFDTGTSGTNVALLDGANTWSAEQLHSATVSAGHAHGWSFLNVSAQIDGPTVTPGGPGITLFPDRTYNSGFGVGTTTDGDVGAPRSFSNGYKTISMGFDYIVYYYYGAEYINTSVVNGVRYGANLGISWTADPNPGVDTGDTNVSRISAGLVGVGLGGTYPTAAGKFDGSMKFTNLTLVGTLENANAAGFQLVSGAASNSVPTLVPNKAAPTTGIGAQAAGNLSVVVAGDERARFGASNVTLFPSGGAAIDVSLSAATGIRVTNTLPFGWTPGAANGDNLDLMLVRAGAASLQLGGFDVDLNAGIVAQMFRTQGALTGGTTNQAGRNFTVAVSPGKGTGVGGSFIVQVAPAGSSGNSVNAFVDALTLDSTLLATFGGGVHLPAGTTARSQLRFVEGVAPTSPVDGDVWREDNTNTGFKIRINGVTKTITLS